MSRRPPAFAAPLSVWCWPANNFCGDGSGPVRSVTVTGYGDGLLGGPESQNAHRPPTGPGCRAAKARITVTLYLTLFSRKGRVLLRPSRRPESLLSRGRVKRHCNL